MVLGLEFLPHFVWSTAGKDRRNGPKDVDITLYSPKKWAGLACKGNPTALHFLFAGNAIRNAIWTEVVRNRHVFLALSFVKSFVGFADDQLKRPTEADDWKQRARQERATSGDRRKIWIQREGRHARLAAAIGVAKNCWPKVRLPLLVPNGIFLSLSSCVRASTRWTKSFAMARKRSAECEEAARSSSLAERADRAAVSRLLTDCCRRAWESS